VQNIHIWITRKYEKTLKTYLPSFLQWLLQAPDRWARQHLFDIFFRKNESLNVFEETLPYFLRGDFTEEPFHNTPYIIRYMDHATWVMNTRADVDDLMNDVGFKPATPIE
jgi:hypothetical protein